MSALMIKHTLIFEQKHLRRLKAIIENQEEDCVMLSEPVDCTDKKKHHSPMFTFDVSMTDGATLAIRFGMPAIEMKRERTEEEEAARQAEIDRHKVTLTVQVDNTP